MSHTTIYLCAVLVFVIVSLCLGALSISRSSEHKFKIEDLLIDPQTQRADPARVVLFSAFIFTTWMMFSLTVNKLMTEGYFTAYLAAWVAPTVTKIIFNKASTVAPTEPQA